MSGKEYITVVVDEQGRARVEAHGVKGRSCNKLTAFITDALGKVQKVVRKPAYYAKAVVSTHQRARHE